MSIFDIEEIVGGKFDEAVKRDEADRNSCVKFQEEVLMPRIKKLKQHKPIRNFAAGVYMPQDFPYGLGQSLQSLCEAEGIGLFPLDCSRLNVMKYARVDLLVHIIDRPFSVILLENFDKIPDLPEKKYIENLLIHSWESDFLTHRNNFFVLFSTTNDYGDQTPDLLKKIKSLDWYGSIRVE